MAARAEAAPWTDEDAEISADASPLHSRELWAADDLEHRERCA